MNSPVLYGCSVDHVRAYADKSRSPRLAGNLKLVADHAFGASDTLALIRVLRSQHAHLRYTNMGAPLVRAIALAWPVLQVYGRC